MRPTIANFMALWVVVQIENLYVPLPHRFARKHFMDGNGSNA